MIFTMKATIIPDGSVWAFVCKPIVPEAFPQKEDPLLRVH